MIAAEALGEYVGGTWQSEFRGRLLRAWVAVDVAGGIVEGLVGLRLVWGAIRFLRPQKLDGSVYFVVGWAVMAG